MTGLGQLALRAGWYRATVPVAARAVFSAVGEGDSPPVNGYYRSMQYLATVPAEFQGLRAVRPQQAGAAPAPGANEHLNGKDVNRQKRDTENGVKQCRRHK